MNSLTDDLTELVGEELANETHTAMGNVAIVWNRIREKVEFVAWAAASMGEVK